MSAEATGWAFKSSPYKGALFVLHLAIADTVNDAYKNELWASVGNLAEKARLGERIVRKGLSQMVADGLLELVSAKDGHVRRYRFLMPADPCTTCTPAQGAPLHSVQKPLHVVPEPLHTVPGTPARGAPYPNRTQEEPKQEPNTLAADIAASHRRPDDVAFDEFWAVYPLRKAKGAAKTAWGKALKRATAEVIIAGAVAYAEDPTRKPEFTKHPATWLNADCWTDEHHAPVRTRAKGTAAALRALDRYGIAPDAAKELSR